ncbi:MAG: TlpA family protein disulfide reductase [Thermoguttaceae bacterium]
MRGSCRRWIAVGWVAACGFWLAGCPGRSADRPGPSVAPAASTAGQHPSPQSPAKVTLRTLDEVKFAELLSQYRGKVVLIDFWAMWCPSCKELFPHAVQLHRELAGRGLAVISVSLDDAENQQAAYEFLVSHQATFDNFIASRGASAKAFELLGIEGGGLPHLKLFDRSGKLRKTLPEPFSALEAAEIDQAVRQLLAEPGGSG